MRAGSAQAEFGKLGPAERAQQIVDEFRLLAGEHQMAAVAGLVGPVERRAAGGALMRDDRLAVFRQRGPEDVEHARRA